MSARVLIAILLATGCGDSPVHAPDSGPVDQRALTPALRTVLVDGGYFPPAEIISSFPLSSRARADSLARAFVRTFGAFREAEWSVTAGSTVVAESLARCGRGVVADSRYPVLESGASIVLVNTVSPAYLAHFCDVFGVPRVIVSVAMTGSAEIGADGTLVPLSVGPMVFFSAGIPSQLGGRPIILSAERAAELAFASTGRRVAATPELMLPAFLDAPYFARWRIVLESPASLLAVRTGAQVNGDVVFIGQDESAYTLGPHRLLIGFEVESRSGWTDSLLDAGREPSPPTYTLASHRVGWPRSVEPAIRSP